MQSPTISVAMPVYNGANYVETAIKSTLDQTYPHFRLVISLNVSTDNTCAILERLRESDSRIEIHAAPTFVSGVENFNRAVRACQTEWVKILCHDDALEPDCLERIVKAIEAQGNDRLGLIGLGERTLFANGYCWIPPVPPETPTLYLDGPTLVRSILAGKSEIPVPTMTTAAVRKEIWTEIGEFDPNYLHYDTFLWYRLLLKYDYLYIPQPVVLNRIHGGQLAVALRRDLQSFNDFRRFFPKFLDEHRDQLKLDWRAKFKCWLRPISQAATTILFQGLKHRYSSALKILLKLPFHWWPFLPPLIVRNYFAEARRTAEIRNHVPLNLLYPD